MAKATVNTRRVIEGRTPPPGGVHSRWLSAFARMIAVVVRVACRENRANNELGEAMTAGRTIPEISTAGLHLFYDDIGASSGGPDPGWVGDDGFD